MRKHLLLPRGHIRENQGIVCVVVHEIEPVLALVRRDPCVRSPLDAKVRGECVGVRDELLACSLMLEGDGGCRGDKAREEDKWGEERLCAVLALYLINLI